MAWKVNLDIEDFPLHEAVVHANSFSLPELLPILKEKIRTGTPVNGCDLRKCTPLGLCIKLPQEPPKSMLQSSYKKIYYVHMMSSFL